MARDQGFRVLMTISLDLCTLEFLTFTNNAFFKQPVLKIVPVIFINWRQEVLSTIYYWPLSLILWLWERLQKWREYI